jgi:pimeloyl-ACP methyl ester carboxylesterase
MDAPTTGPCRTLVLLPGLDGTGRLIKPLQNAIGQGLETLVIPYPPDDALDYDALCTKIIRELPSQPYAIVAESFAGPIALKIAVRKPKGLRALILSASFAKSPRPWLLPLLSSFLDLRYFRPSVPIWLIRALMVGTEAPEELCNAVQETTAIVDPAVVAFRLSEIGKCDVTADLRSCPVPIFYLNGTRDRLLSKGTLRSILKIRPDVAVIDVPGPHLLLQVAPDACARHISVAVESLHQQ